MLRIVNRIRILPHDLIITYTTSFAIVRFVVKTESEHTTASSGQNPHAF